GVVAVDTETTGLDAIRAELVGICLATVPGKGCYIPLMHGRIKHESEGLDLAGAAPVPQQLERTTALAMLKPLCQNVKYDWLIFARHGIRMAPFDDTMLISYCLEGGLHGHGMDELSELHLKHKPIAFNEVCGTGKNQITFDRVALDKAMNYAAEDADVTLRLHRVLKPRLPLAKVTRVYETLERPLVTVLADMELAG
ncbi:MAG: DNA polymerase I, partial [Kiloniellaceae bacterium]|nr:DNA polymerase I [Kiloniellaceae bacterium]